MKDELNTYGITNADGVAPSAENEGKVAFDNDKPGFIRESVTSEQDEMAHVSESYGDQAGASEEGGSDEEYSEQDLSATSSSTASASSSAASASASIGSGLGALAGVVATSVVAAVVVVAAFVSSLVISLSLLMADMYSLTFGVTMTGADERDFEQPIYAILTGEDTYLEQEVKQDTVLLTFDGLEPGKEYRLRVKNAEKVFDEVTAFTTTEPNDKGEIVSRMQGTDVFVTVNRVNLRSSEYYTVIAKDTNGKVVFSKDGMDEKAEYTFKVDEPKDLFLYLTVSGKTYAISKIELPIYDFDNGVWNWSDDLWSATLTFPDKRGGEPLVLTATAEDISRKMIEPTCEEEGAYVHTAKVEYAGKTYTAKASLPIAAYEHNYVLDPTGGTYTCVRCGDSYTNEE